MIWPISQLAAWLRHRQEEDAEYQRAIIDRDEARRRLDAAYAELLTAWDRMNEELQALRRRINTGRTDGEQT